MPHDLIAARRGRCSADAALPASVGPTRRGRTPTPESTRRRPRLPVCCITCATGRCRLPTKITVAVSVPMSAAVQFEPSAGRLPRKARALSSVATACCRRRPAEEAAAVGRQRQLQRGGRGDQRREGEEPDHRHPAAYELVTARRRALASSPVALLQFFFGGEGAYNV
jgi:hypothetical protein